LRLTRNHRDGPLVGRSPSCNHPQPWRLGTYTITGHLPATHLARPTSRRRSHRNHHPVIPIRRHRLRLPANPYLAGRSRHITAPFTPLTHARPLRRGTPTGTVTTFSPAHSRGPRQSRLVNGVAISPPHVARRQQINIPRSDHGGNFSLQTPPLAAPIPNLGRLRLLTTCVRVEHSVHPETATPSLPGRAGCSWAARSRASVRCRLPRTENPQSGSVPLPLRPTGPLASPGPSLPRRQPQQHLHVWLKAPGTAPAPRRPIVVTINPPTIPDRRPGLPVRLTSSRGLLPPKVPPCCWQWGPRSREPFTIKIVANLGRPRLQA